MSPVYTDLARGLPASVPFVGPENLERARGSVFDARLGANENGFGPSPKAVAAMVAAASETWKYPDPENFDIKAALARNFGVSADNVVVGEGIDGLLGYLCRMIVEPGVQVVTSDGAYPTFNFHVAGYGGTLTKVPFRGDYENPDALIAAAEETNARLIYFSNPNNPMGTEYGPDVVQNLIDRVPEGALLILDEAYCEYTKVGTVPVDVADERVIRFRTFSKAYGMAGARVGYGIGAPELIQAFDKIRNHFGMSRISVAGAIAALDDTAHLAAHLQQVDAAKQRIIEIAAHHGFTPVPSATNFVTLDCGKDGDYARKILAALDRLGVFIRMPGIAPMDRCIRVSVGPDHELDAFAAALRNAVEEVG